MKFYKVGTEVKVHTTYIDPVTHVERNRVKHGIVTAVTSQTRLTARIGRTEGYNLNLANGVFENRSKAGTTNETIATVEAAAGTVS
jgi:hypothetical protein